MEGYLRLTAARTRRFSSGVPNCSRTRSAVYRVKSCVVIETKSCVIDGCPNPAGVPGTARGLCRSHYKRLQRYGTALEPLRRAYRNEGNCKVPDCSKAIDSKEYCTKHYANFIRTGIPTGLPKKKPGPCSDKHCSDASSVKGMCRRHYDKNRRESERDRAASLREKRERGRMWICPACSSEFRATKSGVSRKYCSLQCKADAQRNQISLTCTWCAKTFERKSSVVKRYEGASVFCSRNCSSSFRTATRLSTKERRSTRSITPRMRKLYGNTCVICGENRACDYAHLIPAAEGGTTNPDNIYVLCPTHHRISENKPELLTDKERGGLLTVEECWKRDGYPSGWEAIIATSS